MTQSKIITGAPAVLRGESRRLFMRQASALSLVAGAGAPLALNLLAAGSAAAQSAADYRAVVCLFMFGGNDAFNMVLPIAGHNGAGAPAAGSDWAAYTATRNLAPDSIALLAPGVEPNLTARAGSPARLGGVLPIQPANAQGRTYALHPLMGSLQTMFDTDKRLAILPNIGPLVRPTSKAQYADPSHSRPPRLFSHNDQQSMWQTMLPEGATQGWGGRMADAIAGANAEAVFTAVSAAGNAVWLSGQDVRQYQVGGTGAVRLGSDSGGLVYGNPAVASALAQIVASKHGNHALEADVAGVSKRAIAAESRLRSALRPPSDAAFGTAPTSGAYNPANDPKLRYTSPMNGVAEFNAVALQLQVVARLIDAGMRPDFGVRRQVFFVSLGGFDTHGGQNSAHSTLMAKVAHALQYFDTTLGNIGARNNVTTFTGSDFGRTFTSNGDGTDHGWGAHHFVMGGAVRGGDLYGAFPRMVARTPGTGDFNSSDQVRNGALLPTTSVDQLGATLARWFGLSDTQALQVFPNLGNFNLGGRNLGFMR